MSTRAPALALAPPPPSATHARPRSPPPPVSPATHHRPAFAHAHTDCAAPAPSARADARAAVPGSSGSGSSGGSGGLFVSVHPHGDAHAGAYTSDSEKRSPPQSPAAPAHCDVHLHAGPAPAWGAGAYGAPSRPSCGRDDWGPDRRRREGAPGAPRDRLCGHAAQRQGPGVLGRAIMIGWVVTTVGFLLATAIWKGELFAALDRLSTALHDMGWRGRGIVGLLILITTIPPLPLYSTFIVLSGYTGFVTSYIASLVGAVAVFVVSRAFLRDAVTQCLASSATASSLLQILPQRPDLLLLIRIAPYPFNLLNVVFAAAPAMTLRTYAGCTALSLCKLLLHTWVGAGIHDLSAAFHAGGGGGGGGAGDEATAGPGGGGWAPHASRPAHAPTPDELHRQQVRAYATWFGVGLCAVLFVYLTRIAKAAVARAQQDELRRRGGGGGGGGLDDGDETVAFLADMGRETA